MKFKEILFHLALSVLILIVVAQLTDGLLFAKSWSLIVIFFLLYWAVTLASSKVRAFFLLPSGWFFEVIIHWLLVALVFYACNYVLGGITIKPINFPSFMFFGGKVIGTSLGIFGTITVLAGLIGLVYQTLIWLNSEK